MPPTSPNRKMLIAIAIVMLATPLIAQAECVTVTLPKGQRYTGPVAKPTLIFSGTVTATDYENYTVWFSVDRVWKGQLRRETILFVVPDIEGPGVKSFQTGTAYLVTTYLPITVVSAKDVAGTGLPAGAVGISFGCIGGPELLAEAGESLKRLGRGRVPRP